MSRKPFVVYWNNIPAPYMVERFNLLADRANINFEAWFNDRSQYDRSWIVDESNWCFRYRYMNTLVVGGRRLHFPLPLLKRNRPNILVSLYSEPSYLLGWSIAKLRGIKTGFRVVTTFDSWVRRSTVKESLKKWIFPRVDFIVTEGIDGKAFAQHYGAKSDVIFFARHGIDVTHFKDGSTMDSLKRSLLRRELGLKGTTYIYVGRLLKLKGLNYLLDAFREVQRPSGLKMSLILVGDGADEEFFRNKCKVDNIQNVIFAGFRQKNELPKMFAAADVFVFPSLGDPYGLVVDEAMACRLPVISTSSVGEIRERVGDGINGYIVPPEDSHALAEAMLKLVRDPILRRRMGYVSAEKIAGHTPEKWADDFERVVFSMI
ncbi:glycosyltransferase family 4 protein [uncultured Desulfosarcina sp.]|uniref:glycosyltransferase family 4 protein n=1 Tax=uncultured Desulfosarcina sp. TaxID=218289 RepID=UPI0029C6BF94|nr:glycosyltransferase family 4 protein [uncultured Desulfosarcina sp.]